jgi:hypothetical protein
MPTKPSQNSHVSQTEVYEIRLEGHLSSQWADWFGGATITLKTDGNTRLTTPAMDQAALHGLLKKVRDLGMPLISVARVNLDQPSSSDVNANTDHHDSKKEINP